MSPDARTRSNEPAFLDRLTCAVTGHVPAYAARQAKSGTGIYCTRCGLMVEADGRVARNPGSVR